MYAPIIGAGDDYQGHQPAETPQNIVNRTNRLKAEYEDLKRDLSEELSQVDARMIKPAQDAKDSLQMMKKTIKKRDDKKLDFERYQGRVDSGMKKGSKRSDRETAALTKSQSELAAATEAYNAADEHLRACLPRLLTSVFSILPYLLAAQVQIQNNLLAHYYTMLHTYCTEEGFPSPSPPMDEVIRLWEDGFKPVQQEAESIMILASGKAVKSSMKLENGHTNGFRRPSATSTSFHRVPSVSPARALPPSPSYDTKPKISSSPSHPVNGLLSPTTPLTETPYQTPGAVAYSPAGPNVDYFSRERQPSSNSITATTPGGLQKKRPPPPPPPRIPSGQPPALFVTALYDFGGQGEGDLAFREGDRIKVIKKTDSTDDWWQGELRGVRGAFPANYCQ